MAVVSVMMRAEAVIIALVVLAKEEVTMAVMIEVMAIAKAAVSQ